MPLKVSHIEPASRDYQVAISLAELTILIQYHERYVTSLERALPDLAYQLSQHPSKDGTLEIAATQLSLHTQRAEALAALLPAESSAAPTPPPIPDIDQL